MTLFRHGIVHYMATRPKKPSRHDSDLNALIEQLQLRFQLRGAPPGGITNATRARLAKQLRHQMQDALLLLAEAYAGSETLVRVTERNKSPELRAIEDRCYRATLDERNFTRLMESPTDFGEWDYRSALGRVVKALTELGLVKQGEQ